jgi:hypothetical protein
MHRGMFVYPQSVSGRDRTSWLRAVVDLARLPPVRTYSEAGHLRSLSLSLSSCRVALVQLTELARNATWKKKIAVLSVFF